MGRQGDYNPEIFHQKFVLRDYRGGARPTSALLTGSANFTVTDSHRNLNHLVVFHDGHICRQYAAEFEQHPGRLGSAAASTATCRARTTSAACR